MAFVFAVAGCATSGTGQPQPQAGASPAFSDCAGCPEVVAIPVGRFLMGSPADEPDKWEGGREDPRHPVVIAREFAIGKFEVTRAQFARFQADTGRVMAGCA